MWESYIYYCLNRMELKREESEEDSDCIMCYTDPFYSVNPKDENDDMEFFEESKFTIEPSTSESFKHEVEPDDDTEIPEISPGSSSSSANVDDDFPQRFEEPCSCELPGCPKSHDIVDLTKDHFKCCWKGCDTVFSTANGLEKHVHDHVELFKVYSWAACKVTVDNETDSNDEGEEAITPTKPVPLILKKPFACGWSGCLKAFETRYKLQKHKRARQHINPYQCDINNCTESFPTLSQLKAHKKTPHKCFVIIKSGSNTRLVEGVVTIPPKKKIK